MSEIYEGNSITINNINKSKAKIKNRGGSYQETTQGKNLFDNTLKGYGHYGYTAKTITNGIRIIAENDFTKDDALFGVYTIIDLSKYIGKVVRMQADIIPNKSTGAGAYRLGLSNKDSTNRKALAETGTKKEISFTVPELIGEQKYLAIWFYIGTTDSGTKGDYTDYTNIIVTIDNDDMTYEPYTGGTPSPNPDYPQEIQNVGDNINLYDKNNPNILNTPIDSNGTGVNVQNTYKTIWIPCKTNTTYTVSKIFDTTRNRFAVGYSSIEPNYSQAVEGYMSNEKANVLTVTTNTTAKYLLAYVWITGGSTTYEEMLDSIKIEEGTKATSYSNYNCGNLEVTISNKNLYKVEKVIDDSNAPKFIFLREGNVEFTTGGVPLIIAPTTIKEKTEYTYILKCKSNVTTENNINFTGIYEDGTRELLSANKKKDTNEFIVKFKTNKEKTLAYVTQQYTNSAGVTIITEGTMILEGDYLNSDKPYKIHQEQTRIFPLAEGQKLYEGSYLAADAIHNKRKQIVLTGNENILESQLGTYQTFGIVISGIKQGTKLMSNYFTSYPTITDIKYKAGMTNNNAADRLYISNGESSKTEEFKAWLSQRLDEGIPVIIEYELATEEIIPYTPEQQNAFYELQNIVLYDGINHISTDNELGSMSVEVSKIIEDYETYISSNGFFINSQNDIHYLIDFSESELPCMAEATETTVKAAGRNGDIVLSTTYDPNNFNIVCYTEDNLTQEEKVKEEMKLKKLLNSIKNKTIPLAFEKDDKFYKVKYSGAFSSTNFPKHLKFSIPLKTSESYGKDLIKKVIFGNGEETSDTFEDVGAIFTIKGPANSPIISLNDYSIEYDNPLLEGDKLIINSSNSTITHINSDGVKTNAMRYYNHQFPKIENGKNVLKVLSGVNEANVSVEWYDYKF
jgi:hypothetical protein